MTELAVIDDVKLFMDDVKLRTDDKKDDDNPYYLVRFLFVVNKEVVLLN